MRRTRIVALAATVVAAAACGVPVGDDSFEEIPSEDIPFGLAATSTTTTIPPTTTVPESPATTMATTTTEAPIRLEPVEIYFLSRDRLQPVELELPAGFSPEQVADVLESGPPPDVALDTLIEDGLIVSADEAGGVLTVDLDAETFDRIPITRQTEAIGQIVLTMVSSLRRVGQVTFTLEGEPIPVRKGNRLSSEVGEALSYDDYVVLLVTIPPPPDPATTDTVISDSTNP